MKLQKITLIGLTTLILLLSIAIGHFFPPSGILGAPLVMWAMTALVIFTQNDFNILVKSVICYLFIGLNDIGIKLFSGGIHDMEGIGWIHMMLFIGLVPCIIMLVIGVFRDNTSNNWIKAISIVAFILLIYGHLQLFETLGVPVN